MKGLGPRTWQPVQVMFPDDAETAGCMLVQQCGQKLPFCGDRDEYQLQRLRFAALKISDGDLPRLQKAIDQAKKDRRDERMWAGFGYHLDAHELWARELLG